MISSKEKPGAANTGSSEKISSNHNSSTSDKNINKKVEQTADPVQKMKTPIRLPGLDATEENVALFRSVFKGREDIVPQYWKSKRGDKKSGYSFLCENKWDTELCNIKKKIRDGCSTCKNAEYIPLSDSLIRAHLTTPGNIYGVYPLLKNNTCHFIAADFDKHNPADPDPFEDVKKFVEACEVQEIPCYVFRSKSGNGYHVHIFFTDAVPAWKARVVVFALLGEAGVIGDDVELSSFDRLFPNQDKLSGKGFGNLIGLPFQAAAAQHKHTLILDPGTNYTIPFQDQWKVLQDIEKVSEADLDTLIKDLDLKKPDSPKRERGDFKPIQEGQSLVVFSRIKNGCKFIKHCCDDSDKLPEPEWYAFLTIIGRCENGRRLAHKYSEDHLSYNYDDTESKLEHALNDTGPYYCETINNQINGEYCNNCRFKIKQSSPIRVGEDALTDDAIVQLVRNLNKEHAGIMIGGKFQILNETTDPIFNRPDFTLSSVGDYKNRYTNKKIPAPNNPNKKISVADVWLNNPNRREHLGGIVFEPGAEPNLKHYNLWKGFAVEPQKGDWSLLKDHIFNIIANKKESRFKWIMAWLARIIQDPGGKRPGTVIVLRGKQGTGKGVFVNSVGQLFGKHYLQIAQANQVTGRFNHHFKDVLLTFIDEGFWAGDKQAEGVLKNLITEPFITVEQKGKDIIRVKNHVNMIIASNHDRVIPAGLEERRFNVLDIPDTRMQDHKYFNAITKQMENGGLEAMMHELLNLDISDINLRTFEQTDGLFEQKLHSMTTVQKYWYERLLDGSLITQSGLMLLAQYDPNEAASTSPPCGFGKGEGVVIDHQYGDYMAFAARLNDRYPLSPSLFGTALKKMCKKIKKIRRRKCGDRIAIRVFPTLDECRKEFAALVKFEIDWELKEEE